MNENINMNKFYIIGFIEEWLDEPPEESGKYKYIILDYNKKNRDDGFYDGHNTTKKINYLGYKTYSAPNEARSLKDAKKYPTFKAAYYKLLELFKNDEDYNMNDFEYILQIEKIYTINNIPLENKYMITNIYCVDKGNSQFGYFGTIRDFEFGNGYYDPSEIQAYNEET